jgi:hypothetical protein
LWVCSTNCVFSFLSLRYLHCCGNKTNLLPFYFISSPLPLHPL